MFLECYPKSAIQESQASQLQDGRPRDGDPRPSDVMTQGHLGPSSPVDHPTECATVNPSDTHREPLSQPPKASEMCYFQATKFGEWPITQV